jgi:C4-type Zn-finger protein
MIFRWIQTLFRLFAMLFIPPPRRGPRINSNLTCPVCGAEDGTLRCVEVAATATPDTQLVSVTTLCQHRCNRCGARFYEKPVANVNPALVTPAIARNDIERAEDLRNTLQAGRQREIRTMSAPGKPN